MKVCLRVSVVGLMVLSLWQPAEAARITVDDIAAGGGTIVNDGNGDVVSSDSSAEGVTSLMSELGLRQGSLAADLASITLSGKLTQLTTDFGVAAQGELNVLKIVGTLANATVPCGDCQLLSDVNVGSSLGLRQENGLPIDPRIVLFEFNIVGQGLPTPTGWPTMPSALGTQFVTPVDGLLTYQLTTDQIAFILARMGTFNVSDVRIGLAAGAVGRTAAGREVPVQIDFDMPAIKTNDVPEPGTLTLLAAGLAMAGVRRLKKSARH